MMHPPQQKCMVVFLFLDEIFAMKEPQIVNTPFIRMADSGLYLSVAHAT